MPINFYSTDEEAPREHVRRAPRERLIMEAGGLETKVIRRVQDAAYWGKPEGTIIRPGMKPVGPKAIANRVAAELAIESASVGTPGKPTTVRKLRTVVAPKVQQQWRSISLNVASVRTGDKFEDMDISRVEHPDGRTTRLIFGDGTAQDFSNAKSVRISRLQMQKQRSARVSANDGKFSDKNGKKIKRGDRVHYGVAGGAPFVVQKIDEDGTIHLLNDVADKRDMTNIWTQANHQSMTVLRRGKPLVIDTSGDVNYVRTYFAKYEGGLPNLKVGKGDPSHVYVNAREDPNYRAGITSRGWEVQHKKRRGGWTVVDSGSAVHSLGNGKFQGDINLAARRAMESIEKHRTGNIAANVRNVDTPDSVLAEIESEIAAKASYPPSPKTYDADLMKRWGRRYAASNPGRAVAKEIQTLQEKDGEPWEIAAWRVAVRRAMAGSTTPLPKDEWEMPFAREEVRTEAGLVPYADYAGLDRNPEQARPEGDISRPERAEIVRRYHDEKFEGVPDLSDLKGEALIEARKKEDARLEDLAVRQQAEIDAVRARNAKENVAKRASKVRATIKMTLPAFLRDNEDVIPQDAPERDQVNARAYTQIRDSLLLAVRAGFEVDRDSGSIIVYNKDFALRHLRKLVGSVEDPKVQRRISYYIKKLDQS